MAVSYDQLKDGELLRPPPDLPEPALTVNGTKVLERRYLHRIDNRVVETPGGGFWRVAEEVARGGASWVDPAGLEARTREYYGAMASLEFLPNSPTLMNAGKRNGLQYSACYVLPVEDSMDGIFESVKRAALIHKSGGGCIAGDARVWTTFCGIEPIEVLVNRATVDGRAGVRHGAGVAYDVRDLGIQTLSMNPRTGETGLRQVTHVWRFDVPADSQVAVTMREGVVVQTSDWHPFMVVRGTELVEVPAAALLPGDVVLGPDRPDSYWPWTETRTVGSLAIDPDLGWLVGFTLGDGSFGYVPALRQYRVRWFSGARDVLERAQAVLARHGIQVAIQQDGRGVLSLATLTQRFVHDLLEACGLEKIGPKDDLIRVPEVIAKSPLPVVRAFVAGLLDSDGYVDRDGSPSYTTASEAMAEDVAALMGLLGYQPTVRAKAPHGKGRRTTYTVQLCPLPQVDDLARDLGPYLASAQRRERLHSDSRRQTALRLSFRAWRDRLAALGLAKARGDKAGGPGPCADELNRWSCNVGGRVRRDDLRAIAAQVARQDPELGGLLARLAANGQEVARVERAAVAKPYYDLTVEGWNTYAAGRSGLAMVHNTGFAFSRLRPSGDIVGSTGGVASGPVSFMEVFNGATESVKQGGTRRGANMGILRIDHPDVLQFIDCKRVLRDGARGAYESVAGSLAPAARESLRKSLLETQISNFNISLAVTDRFMEALAADGEYELIHPRTQEIVKRLRARDVFDRMVQAAWETGDPGVVFIDRINAGPANPVPEMGPVEATNPCVTADTLVSTADGLRRVGDLFAAGAPVRVLVDGRLSAAPVQAASAVFATGVKPVFRLRTEEGYELRLTADHRLRTDRGWVAARDLVPGDRLHLVNRKGGFGQGGSAELGQVLGWLVGDGTMTAERAILSFFGAEKEELAPAFAAMVGAVVPAPVGPRSWYDVSVSAIPERSEARVRSVRLLRVAEEHGLRAGDKHKVPESVFTGCEAMQRGFLQALFTADGHVSSDIGRGIGVRLTSINRQMLVDVQRLLLNFGIVSRIYTDRRGEGLRLLPDGKGGKKPYRCRAYHELMVSKDNMARFADEIGFMTEAKQQKLLSKLAAYQHGPHRERFTARFAALEPEGEEAVYDLTESVTHSFVANGLVVHNCGEQPLYPNEACNLGSINLARFVRAGGVSLHRTGRGLAGVEAIDWERMERTVRTAIRFLDDVITVNPYPDAHIDRAVKANRRVGLGVMGWADLLIDLEIPYDSEEALRLGTEVMRRLNEWAHDESCRLAEERGPFPNWPKSIYKDGRPQRNATVTTIAPTGTISIIAGCSSGIEPLFALVFDRKGSLDGELSLEVYERFTEVAKREGFWTEDLARQVHKHGTVRGLDAVPEKWQRVFGTAHDIHPDWHVRMQGAFQQHTDNAVSKTINLPHDATPADVERAYTLAYEAGCNGITVYRDGSKLGVLHAGSGGGEGAAAADDGRTMLARPKAMEGITYSVETPLGTAYITVNHDAEQEPREVFVNQGKAGSDIAPLSEAIGKLASIVLRVPSPMPPRERLAEITRRLRGIGGSTSLGFGAERTRSLPDALAKVLEEYLDRPHHAPEPPAAEGGAPAKAAAPNGQTVLPMLGAALNGNGHANGYAALRGPRITGDLCPDCGTALVYEEGCSKCMGCGYARC